MDPRIVALARELLSFDLEPDARTAIEPHAAALVAHDDGAIVLAPAVIASHGHLLVMAADRHGYAHLPLWHLADVVE
jgi:hypothetical protein